MDSRSTAPLAERLRALDEAAEGLRAAVRVIVAEAGLAGAGDDELLRVLAVGGQLQRTVDGLLVEATADVTGRSATGDVSARLTTRYGCHSVSELLQRTTLVAPATAGRWERAVRAVRRATSPSTGELLPAVLPALHRAMLDGVVGVDGLLVSAAPLADLARRTDRSALLAADAALAEAARGSSSDGAPPACADLLRVQATAWAVVLDPDGSEPADGLAMYKRGLTMGRPVDGLVPIRGRLVPEVAAQFTRICDAVNSPRSDGETGGVRFVDDVSPRRPDDPYTDANGPLDDRRSAQKMHDAFATAVFAAAASAALPTIGGASPTLVVSVRESDLVEGRGWAHSDGCDVPLPLSAATRVACAGVVQRVLLGEDGRVLRLGTEERVFNRHQRRAIALRDGGCLIPGCGVPAAWCEIHHVIEHAHGGPTHTDNGVLLCWFHHRYLDSCGWKVRMVRGVPHVRAPSWNDASGTWRRVVRSPTRLADLVVRRT